LAETWDSLGKYFLRLKGPISPLNITSVMETNLNCGNGTSCPSLYGLQNAVIPHLLIIIQENPNNMQ